MLSVFIVVLHSTYSFLMMLFLCYNFAYNTNAQAHTLSHIYRMSIYIYIYMRMYAYVPHSRRKCIATVAATRMQLLSYAHMWHMPQLRQLFAVTLMFSFLLYWCVCVVACVIFYSPFWRYAYKILHLYYFHIIHILHNT